MKHFLAVAGTLALLTGSGQAKAQSLNPNVADFNTQTLANCYTGTDLGALLNMSNPLTLIGSVGYTQTLPSGRTRLQRQPMALPSIVQEAGSPDQTTCSLQLEATTGGSLQILGITAQAERSDVFKIEARLITRQLLSTVVQDEMNVPVWEADQYRTRFRNILERAGGSNYFLVDNINVYLVTVERYRRSNFSGVGIFAAFGGNVSYKRDENFKGARILVTGDTVPLRPEMFPSRTSVINANLPETVAELATAVDVGALSPTQTQRLGATLSQEF